MPGVIPKGDIIFSFDCTGSMSDEISVAKTEAINIMNSLDALISDAQYGVMSYMDYPASYSSCGYSNQYGSAGSGDYAYLLNQPLTSNKVTVSTAINSLFIGWGADEPQDYTRIFYESYSDPAIGYRSGSKKVLINIGDAVPHDCNLNQGVPGKVGTWSTGGDPGRDGVMGTADDLDLQTVLAEMAANNITLIELHGNTYYGGLEYWTYWTSLTGGALYHLGGAEEIPEAIDSLIGEEATHISTLTLEVTTPGYESWLTSVTPPSYSDLTLPDTKSFDIIVTVPMGTPPGTHTFQISAIGDGASYGDQLVTIEVPGGGDTAKVSILPKVWYTSWGNPHTGRIRCWIGELTGGYDVSQINRSTLRLNGTVPMYGITYRIIPSWPGFTGSVLEVAFDRYSSYMSLGSVIPGNQYPVTITGEFNDGVGFSGETMITVQTAAPKLIGEAEIPESFSLIQNYPNPFNPETDISYALPSDCKVNLTIYNLLGQKVKTLVNEPQTAGYKTVHWGGKDEQGNLVASGIYFYKLNAGEYTDTKKMVMTK
jgi:hypothetical protein